MEPPNTCVKSVRLCNMKKLTAKKLYEAIMENQVPSNSDIEDYFPDTELDIVNIIDDWWRAVDEISEIRRRVRKLAEL